MGESSGFARMPEGKESTEEFAEELPDRRRFRLSAEQWKAFVEALDAPARPAPRLAKLLNQPSVFDKGRV